MKNWRLVVIALMLPVSFTGQGEPVTCDNLLSEWFNFSSAYRAKSGFGKFVQELLNQASFKARRESKKLNAQTLADIEGFSPTAVGKSGKIGLTEAEVNQLFDRVVSHPIASLDQLQQYDGGRGVGFCFGRAMTAHLEAQWTFGAHYSHIKKMWIVGQIGTRWQFHVTTIVYTQHKGWMAIDPVAGKLMTAREWYNRWKKRDLRGDALIYESEAKRFGASASEYRKSGLTDDFYNSYFIDLLDHYRRQFREQVKKHDAAS